MADGISIKVLQQVFEKHKDAYAVIKLVLNSDNEPIDWTYVYANPAFYTHSGLEAKEVISSTFSDVFPALSHDSTNWVKKIGTSLIQNQSVHFEAYSEGLNLHFEVFSYPLEGDLAVIQFKNISNPVLEKYRTEALTNKLQMAVDLSEIAVWEWDVQTDKATGNIYWEKLFEFEPKGVSEQWFARIYDDDKVELERVFTEYLADPFTLGSYKSEFRYFHKSLNRYIWLQTIGKAIEFDEQKNPIKLVGATRDITDYKEQYSLLEQQKAFNQKLNFTLPSGIYIYDVQKAANEFINPAYTAITGYTLKDLNALPSDGFFQLFHEEDQAKVGEHIGIILNQKKKDVVRYRFKHKNGYFIWLYSTDMPYEYDELGNVTKTIGSFIDISEIVEMESRLSDAKEAAVEAALQKNLFLANMSHEIRTPINAVIGFSEVLSDGDIDEETQRTYLTIIDRNAKQLLNLIDDIIDVAKIEANELGIFEKTFDLNEMLLEMLNTYEQSKAWNKKSELRYKLSIPPDYEKVIIKTDPKRLRQVFTNLLSNATKFTNEGVIEFGYEIGTNGISCFVKDDGIGIPTDKLEHIFGVFQQIKDINDPHQGTGLGLAICEGIISLLNGHLEVQSAVNEGTTFTFTIPVEVSLPQKKPIKETIHHNTHYLSGRQVLLVEDDEIVQTLVEVMLKPTGVQLHIAQNGKEGVQKYVANPNIELVLMDINMPVMNGKEALTKIIEHNPNAVVVMQTAYAYPEDQIECEELGAKGYLTKPLMKEAILSELMKWMPER